MKVKIYVNEVLYKTVTIPGETYNPADFWPQIEADKKAGALANFGIKDSGYSVRIEKVAN